MEPTVTLNIKGLVSLINETDCLEDFNLSNTRLLIDGNSLAYKIANDLPKELACFNGSYDLLALRTANFFKLLSICNVMPCVVFCGPAGTNSEVERLKTRLQNTLELNPANLQEYSVLPYNYIEIVEDVVKKLNIRIFRLDCVDHVEMTVVAKNLMYPVLSWNLEYFILDVNFIPGERMPMSLFCNPHKYIPAELFIPTLFFNSAFKIADKKLIPIFALCLGEKDIDDTDYESLFSKLKIGSTGDDWVKELVFWLEDCIKHEPIDCILRTVLDALYLDHPEKEEIYKTVVRIMETYDTHRQTVYLQSGLDRYADVFTHKYREGVYPKNFINIVNHDVYLLDSLIEDVHLPHAHTVSLDIIGAIHKLLKKSNPLTIYIRIGKEICQQILPDITLNISQNLSLPEIIAMDLAGRKQLLLTILNVEDVSSTTLEAIAPSWILLLLTCKYLKNKSRFSWPVIYSIILSKIMIMYVDGYIRPIRSGTDSVDKKDPGLKTLKISFKNEEFMPYIWLPDAVCASELMIGYFELRGEMITDDKKFNRSLMHRISEVQSCVEHINHLNSLLEAPFLKACFGDCFNGTFIYNFASKMLEVGSDKALEEEFGYNFIYTVMGCTGTIFECFMIVTKFLKSVL